MGKRSLVSVLLVLVLVLASCSSDTAGEGNNGLASGMSSSEGVASGNEPEGNQEGILDPEGGLELQAEGIHPMRFPGSISYTGDTTILSYENEWEIKVGWDGGGVVETAGFGGMASQFEFDGQKATLLAHAYPIRKDTDLFYRDWASTVKTMTDTLYSMAGKGTVLFVSHDQIYHPDGNTFVFYFELWFEGEFIPVTMAWQFRQSYYLFTMGAGLGGMQEMLSVCKNIAVDFKDSSSEPLKGMDWLDIFTSPGSSVPEWGYAVHNPFWPLYEYLYSNGGPHNRKPPQKQLDFSPINEVSLDNEWMIKVPGRTKVAEGMGGMPWQHVFYDNPSEPPRSSTLLTNSFLMKKDTHLFYKDWDATANAMTSILHAMVGEDAVEQVSHSRIVETGGDIYVYQFKYRLFGHLLPVTMSWRFCQSYYIFAMGVDLGDMPDMPEITIEAARGFEEYNNKPFAGWEAFIWQQEPSEYVPSWNYPVHNPFWPFYEYFYGEDGILIPVQPEWPMVPAAAYDWGEQVPKAVDEALPPLDVFLERYNEAAKELGTFVMLKDFLNPSERNTESGLVTLDGCYDGNLFNADGESIGIIMIEPQFIRLILFSPSNNDRLLVYAATAAGVTGLPAQECLLAMTDFIYNAGLIERDNGYMAYEDEKLFAGVSFKYENGSFSKKDFGDYPERPLNAQMFINWDGKMQLD